MLAILVFDGASLGAYITLNGKCIVRLCGQEGAARGLG